jgi:hypothetical protein
MNNHQYPSTNNQIKTIQNYLKFPHLISSPFDGGGRRWGWTKGIYSPLPFIPSRQGRGSFWGLILKMLEENSQIEPCRNPMPTFQFKKPI